MERDSSTEMTANEEMRIMLERAKDIRAERVKELEQAISDKARELEAMREGLNWWETTIPFDVLNEDAAIRKRAEERKENEKDRERRKAVDEELKNYKLRQQVSYRVVAWIFGAMFIAYVVSAFLPEEFAAQKIILGFWLSILAAFVASITA